MSEKSEILILIDGLLRVVSVLKGTNHLNKVTLLIIEKEILKIKSELLGGIEKTILFSQEDPMTNNDEMESNGYDEKIIDLIKSNGEIDSQLIYETFLEISPRTLRRKLRYLVEQGLIKRFHRRKSIFYKLGLPPFE